MENKPMTKAQVAKMKRLLEKELDGRDCIVLMKIKGGTAITAGQMDPIDTAIIAMGLLYKSCDENAFLTKRIAKKCIKAVQHINERGGLHDADD